MNGWLCSVCCADRRELGRHRERDRRENTTQHLIEDFILLKVRQGAKLPGTYPPSPELLEEFKKTTRESGK